MTSALNISQSGLAAYQKALDVIANNIANANTPGYSRQTIDFTPKASQRLGDSFVGSGVSIGNVTRHSNQFVESQVRTTLSSLSEQSMLYSQSLEVDRLLAQEGTSISASLQQFMNSMSQVIETPDNSSARGVLFNQSHLLADQFQSMQNSLGQIEQNLIGQVNQIVGQVNEIASAIASINNQISSGGGSSPDLLDKRNQLVKELSQFTTVNISEQADGVMNVSMGSGEVIVIAGQSIPLSAGINTSATGGMDIFLGQGASRTAITENIRGGELGGIFEFKSAVLDPANQTLGQMAIGFSLAINQQHTLGMDLNNQIGQNVFTDFNSITNQLSRIYPDGSNSGAAVLSAAISDVSQLQISNYVVVVTNAAANQVQVTRLSDGVSQSYTFSSGPPAPPAGAISFDGVTLNVDNLANLAAQDIYTVAPTKDGAGKMNFLLNNSQQFAIASPVRTQSSLANTGSGAIALNTVTDASGAAISKEYRIDFISPTQYNLVNVTDATSTGPHVFTPNTNNEVLIPDGVSPAYTITLSGIPDSGDSFIAKFNSGGIGDNGNGLLLADIQTQKLFMGATESVFERYSTLIGDVGGKTFQAQIRQESADILHQQAVNSRETISGVNLDEEAANLLRFQQAYQAAGQVMSITKQMMDVLFATFR